MNDELLLASIALTEWLRSTGKTNKSRAGRVPVKLLGQLESAISHAQQSVYWTIGNSPRSKSLPRPKFDTVAQADTTSPDSQ